MASRLSEETLTAVLDSGQQGLAIQADRALDSLAPLAVDLDALLAADDPAAAVQAVPAQALYLALRQRGPEDCLEVLPLLSADQVARVFDYDVWSEDRLEPLRAARWLNLFKEGGQEELYRRFRDLDEEYQVALLSPLIELYDEEDYERMTQTEQDALNRLPCGTLFYRVKSEDPRLEEFVSAVVEAALAGDMNYAYSLLSHAAYAPPNEAEGLLSQFRRARLEEDGFVTFEESLAAFQPVDSEALKRRWDFALHRDPAVPAPAPADAPPFLLRVLAAGGGLTPDEAATVTRGLAALANLLCAVAHVAPDDVGGLRRLLGQAQAAVSLGLEHLAGGDVRVGRDILRQEHPRVLFGAGLTLVRQLADAFTARLIHHRLPGAEAMKRHLTLDKRGLLERELERSLGSLLGFERVETLKGLFHRFPVRPVAIATGNGDRGSPRVTFKPIASLAELAELGAAVDGISGLLELAALADDDVHAAAVPLDRRLLTSLAQALLGGAFRYAPLAPADVARLADMPQEAAQALTSDVFAGMEGTLRMALAPTASADWSASRQAGIPVADPVQAVMAEFATLVMGLHAAREHARAGDRPGGGLNGLVTLQQPSSAGAPGPEAKL